MIDSILFNTIKLYGLTICSLYIYCRSVNYSMCSNKQKIATGIVALTASFALALIPTSISQTIIIILLTVVCICFLLIVTKNEIALVTSGYLFSLGISYIFQFFAILITSIIYRLFTDSSIDTYLFYITLVIVHCLLTFLVLRIKRFKNGFQFLKKRYAVIFSLILFGSIIFAIALIVDTNNQTLATSIILSVFIIGFGIYIWIRRGITMYYKKKVKERNIEILEEQLRERDGRIEALTAENMLLSAESHKINKRLSALERMVLAVSSSAAGDSETAAELAGVMDEIKRLSDEYQADLRQLPAAKPLPSTKIKMLDGLFDHFRAEAAKKHMDFHVKLNGSIPYMTDHILAQSKLETMLGDHIQDAIIAVDAGNGPFRSILVFLGLAGDCYELTVTDSGVEFETDTLLRLGTERVTTHRDSGGSGIGFMTTFDTMRECAASLVIEEKAPSDTGFTKSVTIRFDGKGAYIIRTYRRDQFPERLDRDITITGLSG